MRLLQFSKDVSFKRCFIKYKNPFTVLFRPMDKEVDISLNLNLCIETQRMGAKMLS